MRILLILALLLLAFTSAQANDGDTLTINGITYRLDGIDAPELDQNCIDEVGDVYPCGQLAHKVLQQFTAELPIHCDDLGPDPKYPQRRIGHCTTDGVDLRHWLVKEGEHHKVCPTFGSARSGIRSPRFKPLQALTALIT